MQTCVRILHAPDKQLWDRLQATKKEVKPANRRVEKAEINVQERKDCLQIAKTKLGALFDAKDKEINLLRERFENWEEQLAVSKTSRYFLR